MSTPLPYRPRHLWAMQVPEEGPYREEVAKWCGGKADSLGVMFKGLHGLYYQVSLGGYIAQVGDSFVSFDRRSFEAQYEIDLEAP